MSFIYPYPGIGHLALAPNYKLAGKTVAKWDFYGNPPRPEHVDCMHSAPVPVAYQKVACYIQV